MSRFYDHLSGQWVEHDFGRKHRLALAPVATPRPEGDDWTSIAESDRVHERAPKRITLDARGQFNPGEIDVTKLTLRRHVYAEAGQPNPVVADADGWTPHAPPTVPDGQLVSCPVHKDTLVITMRRSGSVSLEPVRAGTLRSLWERWARQPDYPGDIVAYKVIA